LQSFKNEGVAELADFDPQGPRFQPVEFSYQIWPEYALQASAAVMQTRNTIFTMTMPLVIIPSQASESSDESICKPCEVTTFSEKSEEWSFN
jgi:hypothetical protein